jgi:hypothetical protein
MLHYKLYTVLFSLSNVLWFDFFFFLGNSTNRKFVFKLQKKAIRVIMGAKNNDSCREFFKLLKILPLSAQYIFNVNDCS